jgi:hypothetical protein
MSHWNADSSAPQNRENRSAKLRLTVFNAPKLSRRGQHFYMLGREPTIF